MDPLEVILKALTPAIEEVGNLFEQGQIKAVGASSEVALRPEVERIDAAGRPVIPGLVDVHIHGLLGYDSMGAHLADVIPALPAYGVTSFMATTLTLPRGEVIECLHEMAEVLAAPPSGARCLGIHIEGPHLAPSKPDMATADWVYPLTWEDFQAFQEAAGGHIRMITFAPETGRAMDGIPQLVAAGVVPVIGHTDATFDQVARAVELGAKLRLPNTLIVPLASPAAAGLPVDLLQTRFSSHVLFADGVEQPSYSYFGGSVSEAKCGGQNRPALSLHPPPAGRSLADWQDDPPEPPLLPAANALRLALEPERVILHARIDLRFRTMVADGALEEAAALAALNLDSDLPAMRAIGVRPLIAVVRGEVELEEAIARGQAESRQYAKRQLTWMRHQMADWTRLAADDLDESIARVATDLAR